MDLESILQQVAAGELTVAQAVARVTAAEGDLGFARVDLERQRRCGLPEVIFAEGKTPEQVIGVMGALREAGQGVLATRVSPEVCAAVREVYPETVYHEAARVAVLGEPGAPGGVGRVGVVCAGTSDLPVAEEAALTAEWMGARVERVYDVGVAGLHRLTRRLPLLRTCRALVVVAGMEGALPSVVGGLLDKPIVAVPTHIGYGANLGGMAALLAMLNSCVPGITVVNIDNGFGAGVAAALMNRIGEAG